MQKMVYAAYHKDSKEVEKSSSGAMFAAFSDSIIEKGGVVIGAGYDYAAHELVHMVCRTKEERDLCRGSKYIQSRISPEIYKETEQLLKTEVPVLYIGTPCQIDAMKKYLNMKEADQSRFYTCDILCHGVGSPGIWQSFIYNLERKKRIKIDYLTFKDKRKGWKKPTCIARADKKEFSLQGYSWLYFSDSIMRPACHACKYTAQERTGDVTIGDFWKVESRLPEMYNRRGTSFVMINSEKGRILFEEIRNELVAKECSLEDILQNSMDHPVAEGYYRVQVMRDFQKQDTAFFFGKWKWILLIDKVKRNVRRMFRAKQ